MLGSASVRCRADTGNRCSYADEIRPVAGRHTEYLVMLETVAIVLLILWALGLVSSYTMGGFIHILLVAALVIVVVRVIQRRA